MVGELPYLNVLRGGEVPPTAPPTYDYDNRMVRDFKQNEAIQEIVNPMTPEILSREPLDLYQYQQNQKKKRGNNNGRF